MKLNGSSATAAGSPQLFIWINFANRTSFRWSKLWTDAMAEKFRGHKISSKWKTLTSKQRNLNTYTAMMVQQLCEPRAKSTPYDRHMRRGAKEKPANRRTKKEMKRIDPRTNSEEHAKGYDRTLKTSVEEFRKCYTKFVLKMCLRWRTRNHKSKWG